MLTPPHLSMERIVTENPLNTLGNMSPLIFFDMIFDLDFGMISTIAKQYLDPEVFDEKKFRRPVKQIIQDLYYREERNPLVSFLRPEHQSEAEEYYRDIRKENYVDLVDNSMVTEIFNIIRSFSIQPDITVSILVDKEYEETIWKEYIEDDPKLSKIEIYYRDKLNTQDIGKIQQLFCKYPTDVLNLPVLALHKSVYLANYSFNFATNEKYEKELDLLSFRNSINCIDLYRRSIIGGLHDE